jgi:hypothetical protein
MSKKTQTKTNQDKVAVIPKMKPRAGKEPFGSTAEENQIILDEMQEEKDKRVSRNSKRANVATNKIRASSAPSTKKSTTSTSSKKQRLSLDTTSSSKDNADSTNNNTFENSDNDAIVTMNDNTTIARKSKSTSKENEDNVDPFSEANLNKAQAQLRQFEDDEDQGSSLDSRRRNQRNKGFRDESNPKGNDGGDDNESGSDDSKTTGDTSSIESEKESEEDSSDDESQGSKSERENSMYRSGVIQTWDPPAMNTIEKYQLMKSDQAHELWLRNPPANWAFKNWTSERISATKTICKFFDETVTTNRTDSTISAIGSVFETMEENMKAFERNGKRSLIEGNIHKLCKDRILPDNAIFRCRVQADLMSVLVNKFTILECEKRALATAMMHAKCDRYFTEDHVSYDDLLIKIISPQELLKSRHSHHRIMYNDIFQWAAAHQASDEHLLEGHSKLVRAQGDYTSRVEHIDWRANCFRAATRVLTAEIRRVENSSYSIEWNSFRPPELFDLLERIAKSKAQKRDREREEGEVNSDRDTDSYEASAGSSVLANAAPAQHSSSTQGTWMPPVRTTLPSAAAAVGSASTYTPNTLTRVTTTIPAPTRVYTMSECGVTSVDLWAKYTDVDKAAQFQSFENVRRASTPAAGTNPAT